ncbi:MAG: hypothetical protein HQM14_12995 [SAR324 cluster bacterium]|nr:hypothetical protein [SAR324 cluster bacterium]
MDKLNELTQIFYEISMSIGTYLDFKKMLRAVSLVILRKLNCTSFVVLETRKHHDRFYYDNVFITPRNYLSSDGYAELIQALPHAVDLQEFDTFQSKLPIVKTREDEEGIHLMDLPNYGLLVIFRKNGPLHINVIRSFLPITQKLAVACKACLYHERLEEQVHIRTQELEESNSKLQAEIEYAKKIEVQLIDSKTKAESANQAKTRFLANMSHEIRTPLNSIIGFNGILLRQSQKLALPDKFKKYLEYIKSNSDLLLELVNQVLEMSKIESNSMELLEKDFNMREALQPFFDSHTLRATQKGVILTYDIHSNVPDYIHADHVKILQILTNLVGNAIKFTPAGKEIYFQIYRNQNTLEFIIKDQGIGIDKEDQGRIFKAFEQVDDSSTRNFDGSGLGLSITKRLIDLMEGQISVQSLGKGTGSTFHFSIPFREAFL